MVTEVMQSLFIKKKNDFRYFQELLIKMLLNSLNLFCSGNIYSVQFKIQFILAQNAEIALLII